MFSQVYKYKQVVCTILLLTSAISHCSVATKVCCVLTCLQKQKKNTIRDGRSTALYRYAAKTVYTVQTDSHCLNSSMYAYLYCYGRLERYWNGLMGFSKKNVGLEGG